MRCGLILPANALGQPKKENTPTQHGKVRACPVRRDPVSRKGNLVHNNDADCATLERDSPSVQSHFF
jgi:hypothetical protein